MFKRVTGLATLALFASVGWAQAQTPLEIGTDAAFSYSITGSSNGVSNSDVISFDLPASNWRLGIWVNDTWSVEPALGVGFTKITDDGPSLTSISASADVLYNFPSGLFVHGGGLLDFTNVSPGGGGESVSVEVFGVGGGVGYRTDLIGMLKLRFGARYAFTFENSSDGVPSASNIAGTIGFSMFTR